MNDILVQGARPLFFLDYFASSKLNPALIADVVGGMAKACREAGCALIGGETAEMPGVYQPGEFDVAGTIVGVVDRDRILPKKDLHPGDVLIGIRSTGPAHQRLFAHPQDFRRHRRSKRSCPNSACRWRMRCSRRTAPTCRSSDRILAAEPSPIKALAHLTGGGWIENPIRVFPEGIGAEVKLGSWPVPPLFSVIQQKGEIDPAEMYRVFNMGIGMLVVAAKEDADRLRSAIPEETWIVGELVAGECKVILK